MRKNISLKPEDEELIRRAASILGLKHSHFIIKAVRFYIEHNDINTTDNNINK